MNDDINTKLTNSKQNIRVNDDTVSMADILAEDTEVLTQYDLDTPDFVSIEDLRDRELSQTEEDLDNPSPASMDAGSAAGHAPNLDIDDDVVATAQTMGLAMDDTEEDPAELNIADAVDQAEKAHWEN